MKMDTEVMGSQRQFPMTDWASVRSVPRSDALDILIRRYWKPLYFYVRRHRFDVETSKDIVQEFIAALLSHDSIQRADPKLGLFRTFVLAALSNFIKDWTRSLSRLKRGGGRRWVSLDFGSSDGDYVPHFASEEETPERVLDRAWARNLLRRSLSELRGNETHLKAFRLYWNGDCFDSISERTGLPVGAAKVAVHRMRGKLRLILVAHLAETSATHEELETEISEFIGLFSRKSA